MSRIDENDNPTRSKERKLSELADLAHLALEKMGLTLVEIINEINMAQVSTTYFCPLCM